MPPLHRHQLAHLSAAGWQAILAMPWDDEASACLAHWAAHALPLVVSRQPAPRLQPQALVALGLAAPLAWQRRRLALRASPAQIAWFTEFPTLAQVMPQIARTDLPSLRKLQTALHRLGVRARVYGSAGWQHLTGLDYVHQRSDLDLWIAVDDDAQADQVATLLQACRARMRIDGELVFPHGGAVAWREWAAWREGRCQGLLVKHLHGAALAQRGDLLPAAWPRAA
ncbi:malonate decarboxylase holo-(acyl-carrier-protein) synthase [Burkholderiales bacterium JOSHI_001]|nr:malonate decarboxylase holo-(acyl-carrier-protein) synthase [Burkholderiales bacterium JOSHI_001]